MDDTKEAASQSGPIRLVSRPKPATEYGRIDTFRRWIQEQGLKETAQRDEIARVFLASSRHMSIEELFPAVRHVSPRVSYAPVYRTMRVPMECGFAEERHFADGHHDHLICERCGRIVEYIQPRIEQLQEELAKRFGVASTTRKLEIYGICQYCRERRT